MSKTLKDGLLELTVSDRNVGLYIDGKRVVVESAHVEVDGINVSVVFKTTLGAIAGEVEPKLERIWAGFREHEHAEIRVDPSWPAGGMVKIIGVTAPESEGDQAFFTVRALTPVYTKGALFLRAGQTGKVPPHWIHKVQGGIAARAR